MLPIPSVAFTSKSEKNGIKEKQTRELARKGRPSTLPPIEAQKIDPEAVMIHQQ
jgi:hypothetical protein